MSIKVKITKKHSEIKEFPRLMISELGQIVLALGIKYPDDDASTMKIVMIDDNSYPIPSSNGYTENFTKNLKDFNGELTLSNS